MTLNDELPSDLQEAINACKEFQKQRPGAPADPPVYVVEVCGETCVCMPPTFEANERLNKLMLATLNDKTQIPRFVETYVAETLFWMRGQAVPGQKGALDHAKAVRKSHFSKFGLFGSLANTVQEEIGSSEQVATAKKY